MAAPLKFSEQLKRGQIGEGRIAAWLRGRGWSVLPVYDIEIDTGKGPRVFTPDAQLIAPDILAFRAGDILWIEAKRKSVFTWHRITSRWVTGIDLHHYSQYLKVADLVEWPVWLLFLHENSSHPSRPNEPWPCPTGLFGGSLKKLAKNENHRHENWGRSGMVYWSVDVLSKIAEVDERS